MINVYKYDPRAHIPTRTNSKDAGLDLRAIEDVFIPIGTTVKIDIGLALEVPEGYVGKIEDRSSMGALGLKVSGGVVDAGYNGRLSVILTNLTCTQDSKETKYDLKYDTGVYYTKGYQIKAGDRIAQMLIYKVVLSDACNVVELWDSERGNKGLGSSGK